MVQTCSKCSRANPSDAVYCYFDGFVLGGHSHNGGPVAVGAQAFAHPFVFPTGRQCRSFDELALACQEDWSSARNLLKEGYLENFFGGLGRVDLAMTAKESAKFPDADLGLDQLLEKLPSDVLAEPKLALETQEINLGTLEIGAEREFHLRMENQGMRMISGTVTSADAAWLALGDTAGNKKHFQFQHDLALPIRVRPDKLRANTKPLEVHLEVETTGGSFIVTVRAQVPVKPFPTGALAGAKSPRQAAEKAKANSKDAAVLFENGAVADWYKSNGWTYPVQGPAASGMAAIQQFFEALGLTAPPKVAINTEKIDLSGSPGEKLTASIEIKTQEKRPVYAHATSNQPWLEVGRAKLAGRVATINLSIPNVPNKDGETLTAKLLVQSNGNQRFVVPVTLQIGAGGGYVAAVGDDDGNAFAFGEPEPTANVEMVTTAPEPAFVPPPPTVASKPSSSRRHRASKGKPAWMHALPALLLLLVLGIAAAVDHLTKSDGSANNDSDIAEPGGGGEGEWTYILKDSDPLLAVRFNDDMRFGLEMTRQKDPHNPDKFKKLLYDEHGASNNTIIKIDGFEHIFGRKTRNNIWARGKKKLPIKGRRGFTSTMEFTNEKVEAVQHIEIVPGQSGYLDTLLVYYIITNKDDGKHHVGVRVMLDTYIGANDGVPFTIPGKKGFVNTKADFPAKQIPDYIEVIEKPNDPKDPGTVARMGLRNIRLPGVDLEEMDMLRICRFPGQNARWEGYDVLSMKASGANDKGDSCVLLYWPYQIMNPGDTHRIAFTYGLGSLDIGGDSGGSGPALALSVPASVQPDHDFVATAYVWHAKKGAKVKLEVPKGLQLAKGEKAEKAVELEKGSSRSQVFWHLHSGSKGEYTLEADLGDVKAKPKKVVVKATSIFG